MFINGFEVSNIKSTGSEELLIKDQSSLVRGVTDELWGYKLKKY